MKSCGWFACCFAFFPVILTGCGSHEPSADLHVVNPEKTVMKSPDIVRKSTVRLGLPNGGLCSGVVVSSTRILTAKHCIQSLTGSDYLVSFGVDMYSSGVTYIAGKGEVRVHPLSDLAVIALEAKIPSQYQPAPIHLPNSLTQGTEVVAAGYGRSVADDPGSSDRYLRWGTMVFQTWLAETTLVNSSNEVLVYRSVLQFLPGAKGSLICQGDSGGPVYAQIGGKWGLVGINSGVAMGCVDYALASDPRANAAWILKK